MVAYTNYRRDPRVRREAEALVAQGHRVSFLARRQAGEPDRETLCGVEVVKLPGLRHARTSMLGYMADYLIFFALVCMRLMWQPRRWALIHVNNMPDFLVFAAWLPRLLGRPVIHDVHDLMPELYQEKFAGGQRHPIVRLLKLQERWAGRFASAVLTVEERLRGILSERGIPRRKIHILMNLPDERVFARRSGAATKAPGAPFVIAYHGTLAHRLGLDIAIEAFAIALPQIGHAELRIIGAGEQRDALIALRDRLGLQQRVTFSDGFVAVESIPSMIQDADVGVVPLRICEATDIMLPTKLLEYVWLGVPCIVARTGTIQRYFDDSMVEFFENENPQSLAQSMVALYRDPSRRASLAEEAYARFAASHTWNVHKAVYTELVDSLLRGQPSTSASSSEPGAVK
jgi:glycosyltransferase involved in cell wall biosynthesis